MEVLNTLLPVFLMIALGTILRRTRFLSAEVVSGLNSLVFWIGLPSLLFYEVATASYDYQVAGKTFLSVLAATILCIIVGYIVSAALRMPVYSVGAFVQGAFRGNLYYVGLAVLLYSLENVASEEAARLKNIAILVLALIIPLYNMTAVVVLLAGRHKLDRYVFWRLGKQIITNPLIIACVAGAVYPLVFPPLPQAIARSLTSIGQISLPLALITIGAALVGCKVAGYALWAFISTAVKLIIAPLAGLLAAYLFNLGTGETRIAMIFMACPTAAVSYVMTEQLGGDDKLAAAIVALSTVLSIIPLSAVLALF